MAFNTAVDNFAALVREVNNLPESLRGEFIAKIEEIRGWTPGYRSELAAGPLRRAQAARRQLQAAAQPRVQGATPAQKRSRREANRAARLAAQPQKGPSGGGSTKRR